jgi:hypothetical protein
MSAQPSEVQGQESKRKRRRIPWLRLGVFLAGLLLIAAAVIFNLINAVDGVIAFAALTLLMALIQYAFPLASDAPPIAVTIQQPAVSPALAASQSAGPAQEMKQSTWTIPYRRNALFTGREDLLQQLDEQLHTSRAATLTQP